VTRDQVTKATHDDVNVTDLQVNECVDVPKEVCSVEQVNPRQGPILQNSISAGKFSDQFFSHEFGRIFTPQIRTNFKSKLGQISTQKQQI
jgi:hypothetical protein